MVSKSNNSYKPISSCDEWKKQFSIMAESYMKNNEKRIVDMNLQNIIKDVNTCTIETQLETIHHVIKCKT